MKKPIPKIIYSNNDKNKPFDIYRLTHIHLEKHFGQYKISFHLDTKEIITWDYHTLDARSIALSEIYKVTDAVKI